MKKTTICFSLLFIFPLFVFGQEVFIDESSGKEYLFLGSITDTQKKWLDLENNKIIWIDNNQLQRQSDQLNPGKFFEKIIESKLIFYAEGNSPYWGARISKNKLQILGPAQADGEKQELTINMELRKEPIDSMFLLMFQSEDRNSYGVIRKLWGDTPCDISISDETSVFEVFINNQGEILKGCATLDKLNEGQ